VIDPQPGCFLIASPHLQDPNFRRAVVLLCEHESGEGSMGVIVNRPSEWALEETLRDAGPLPGHMLWHGGPVQKEAIVVVHRDAAIPGAKALRDGLAVGGEEEAILAHLRAGQTTTIRVFSGYSGWGAGHLAGELDERSWIVCPASNHAIFDVPPGELWQTVLRSLGPRFAYLADLPLDPRVN